MEALTEGHDATFAVLLMHQSAKFKGHPVSHQRPLHSDVKDKQTATPYLTHIKGTYHSFIL